MPLRAASILTTVFLVFMFGAAQAQRPPARPMAQDAPRSYHRCGPQGQDLRDGPCPDGQGRALELPKDEVDPKAAAEARRRAAVETRELAARQRERERLAAAAPAPAAGIDGRLAAQRPATRPAKPADPKKPKPKDPKQPPKKKPKVPKPPEPSLPPTPTAKARKMTKEPRPPQTGKARRGGDARSR